MVDIFEYPTLQIQPLAQGKDHLWNELNEELTDAQAVLKTCQAVNKCVLV